MPKFDTRKFIEFKNNYELEIIQIRCEAETQVLFQRFKARSESGERHPGHVDYLNYEEFKTTLNEGGYDILDIGGKVFEIDTTDFEKIDYKILLEALQSVANSAQHLSKQNKH